MMNDEGRRGKENDGGGETGKEGQVKDGMEGDRRLEIKQR